jgi:hypothetical protein
MTTALGMPAVKTTDRMVIWEGPSELTGEPIMVIATGAHPVGSKARASANEKTGDMIQVTIMRSDVNPTEALKRGLDVAVCGDCIHRSKASGGAGDCYTHKNLRRGFAQAGTFRAHAAHGSLPFDVERFRGRKVRFGAYGDPAAVPLHIWLAIYEVSAGFTGYTHQWKTADPRFAELFMASADSVEDRRQARLKGYRTFRVRLATEDRERGEIVCPSSAEAGVKTDCATCLQCSGTALGRKLDIVIIKH